MTDQPTTMTKQPMTKMKRPTTTTIEPPMMAASAQFRPRSSSPLPRTTAPPAPTQGVPPPLMTTMTMTTERAARPPPCREPPAPFRSRGATGISPEGISQSAPSPPPRLIAGPRPRRSHVDDERKKAPERDRAQQQHRSQADGRGLGPRNGVTCASSRPCPACPASHGASSWEVVRGSGCGVVGAAEQWPRRTNKRRDRMAGGGGGTHARPWELPWSAAAAAMFV